MAGTDLLAGLSDAAPIDVYGLGIIAMALTLTAAGYGFEGWAILGTVATVLLLTSGIAIIVIEHRRVKHREGHRLQEQEGH
ncbi:hypothetical protein HLB23_12765 [Nocardia uniformis]|uniref:Uncharacterized protein n=1 Tax=Nocardia uniformis TaxID=53432 RepID=A0A849BZX6_9NOCA|nr:hypothetical protein [Nocardia uniformis]